MVRIQTWAPFALVLAVVSLYGFSLNAPFQYDDLPGIALNGRLQSLESIPSFFTSSVADSRGAFTAMWRPATLTTYSINYALSGTHPFSFRLWNLLLHAANALIVLLLLRSLFESRWSCAAGALLFAVHPLATQTVLLVWKRSGLLSTFFVLSAACIFLKVSGWKRAISVGLLMILALMCKEDAITLPFLLVSLWLFRPKRPQGDRPWEALGAGFGVLTAFTIFWIVWITPQGSGVGGSSAVSRLAPFGYLLGEAVVSWRTLALMVFPHRLNVDHYFHPSLISMSETLFSVACFLLAITGLLSLGRKRRRILLASSFLFFPLLPFFFIQLPIYMDESRAYLPLVGLAILFSEGLEAIELRFPEIRRGVMIMTLVILSAFATRTAFRVNVWRDGRKLWADSMRQDPRNLRARNGLVFALLDTRQFKEALPIAERSVRIAPGESNAWLALARVQDALQMSEAEKSYTEHISLDPRSVDGWNSYGAWLAERKRYTEAIEKFERALVLDPTFPTAKANLDLALRLAR